ncbi:unnamed protein product [Amaranthus hypochondriacus]
MGCAQSRIDNEESVSRCKERKILMKEALLARTAFAVGHSAYAIALKNAGSALSDYGHGETSQESAPPAPPTTATEPPPPPPPPETEPEPEPLPPPPPLPNFTPSPSPLQRSVTMPEFSVSKRGVSSMGSLDEEDNGEGEEGGPHVGGPHVDGVREEKIGRREEAWDYFFMSDNNHMMGDSLDEIDEEDEEEEEEEEEVVGEREDEGIDFKTPEKAAAEVVGMEMGIKMTMDMETPPPPEAGMRHFEHSKTAPAEVLRGTTKVENGGGNKVNLMKVLGEIDDYFLKASECVQEVTKLLEAHKLHYHSNFADNKVPVDHAARVMRVITWSSKGMPEGGKNDYEDNETLATVLDKLMAWEKKLYEEVKAGELMKMEYQRKVSILNRQKKRGVSAESLEKTKAAVSHLHTRYIVDMQSMDSTVLEVNELRDQQLYPKLAELVDGMAKMWEDLSVHHDSQLEIAAELKSLDVMLAPRETSKPHYQCTVQLSNVIQQWQDRFETLVNQQKQYVRSLNCWLKLNLIPIESSLKEKISSPPRVYHPPIQSLLHAWHDSLEKLPDEVTKTAISSFGAVIKTIILHQEEEMKLKEKCEETRKEFLKKNQAYEDWYHKYMQRKGPEAMDPERGEDGVGKDPVSERQFVVESLRKRLEEDLEKYHRHCVQVREKSLGTLKTRLPELFRALSEYAHACYDAYNKLRAIVLSHGSDGVPS